MELDLFSRLLKEVNEITWGSSERDKKLLMICKLLKNNVPYYDWVGFYIVDNKSKEELILGPYEGEPTEHVRISFGEGICGQAAGRKDTFIVQDVSKEVNYLSCSPEVKSEIVIPLIKDGEIIGELDIDSHKLSPFTEEDRKFLEEVARLVNELF